MQLQFKSKSNSAVRIVGLGLGGRNKIVTAGIAHPGLVVKFLLALHPYVELSYAVVYFMLRGIVGPLQWCHIAYTMVLTRRGRQNVNVIVGLVWSVLLLEAACG